MAPSKKRAGTGRPPPIARHGSRTCPCLDRSHSTGICELNVWHGTTIDPEPVANGKRLLRPHLPVIKYKDITFDGLSGHMYVLILLNWIPLLGLFAALYILVVGIFALLLALCNQDFSEPASKVRDYFNLSLQTMATIGYGVLAPRDSCSNWIVVIESFVSMIAISLMTGVAFVKFARPRPHIIFSNIFTVSQSDHHDGLELRFRVVNGTRRELIMTSEILEVSFKLLLMRIETARNGEKKMCYYDLHLKTTSYITLRLEAEIVHNIDENSPLYGMTEQDISQSDFLIILMMSGVDETLHDMVHQQFEYTHNHMRWGSKFTSILKWDHSANRIDLDFDQISEIVPAPIEDDKATHRDVLNSNDTELSTETQGNGDMMDEIRGSIENIAEDEEGRSDLKPQGTHGVYVQHRPAIGVDYSDLESMRSFRDDQPSIHTSVDAMSEQLTRDGVSDLAEDDDESSEVFRSEGSIGTNSGSENNEERHETTPARRVRFDRRSRTASLRLPRIRKQRKRRNTQSGRIHAHHIHDDGHDQPMSLLRRRVRFKNHPFSRFSKGLYYRALETSWWRLFLYLAFLYFAAIGVIALLMYLSTREAISQTSYVKVHSTYEELFFFCAQTISTIGYGALSPNPNSDVVNFFVFLLAFMGVVVSTLVTGLAWAKFSIPKASTVIFSDCLLLTAFHSHRAIMFRAANSRSFGAIIEGSFRVSVVILNQRLGHKETHELKLVRNVWPVVQLGTTVTHIIDEDSPLYNISTNELLSGHHFFVVLFTGFDPVVTESMFSRKTYHSCDILVGHHFVDNIKLSCDGVHIDLEAINDTKLTPDTDLRDSRLFAPQDSGPISSLSSSQESDPIDAETPLGSQTTGSRRRQLPPLLGSIEDVEDTTEIMSPQETAFRLV